MTQFVSDAQALAFVQNQAYKINPRVYETQYPDWDFGRLVYVDQSGPEWAPGVVTYSMGITGGAEFVTSAARDMPVAEVNQSQQSRGFELLGVGYRYNLEEINMAIQVGGNLDSRRALAARKVYQKRMFDITMTGDAEKGWGGLINYGGITSTTAPADGTGSVTFWVDEDGVGTKTPAQIVRDINIALQGIYLSTNTVEMADTLLLPVEAYNYLAQTPYSAVTMDTILSFVQRTNIYTQTTGQSLTIRAVRELGTAGTGGTGRLVAYKNDAETVRLHLPMAHRFLPVQPESWGSWIVPGIFRTGGIEVGNTAAFRYVDGISEPPAA